MRFLYICSPIDILLSLLLTLFSGSVLFEELLNSYKYVLAPLLCPSPVHRRVSQKCYKRQEVKQKQVCVCVLHMLSVLEKNAQAAKMFE